ncbi:MAG: sel1 repeat family protein [Gammaproteobacteria bacterium]|nr:sel1 repeat family protein [Gammaproteobacteria bacterium]
MRRLQPNIAAEYMADLSGLNLLRNDPEKAAELIAAAERGDMDAQYAAGLLFAEGRGVPIDLVQSYFWLTQAITQGDADAERLRAHVAAEMDDATFAAARRLIELARRAMPAFPEGSEGGYRH